jgi:hypothetical protein
MHEVPWSRFVNLKVWTDPQKKRTERRRSAGKKRREGKKSDCSSESKRVLVNIIPVRSRADLDMTLVEARASVIAHAQTSVVPAVEASGKLLLQDFLCFALVTILCVADVSGRAWVLLGKGLGGLGLGSD